MTQEEFAEQISAWKQELIEEVIPWYKSGDEARGQQSYLRWEERFHRFLKGHSKNEANRFWSLVHPSVSVVSYIAGPYTRFMQRYGEACIAFLEEIAIAVRKAQVLDFAEQPDLADDNGEQGGAQQTIPNYVDASRIEELRELKSTKFDLQRLARLCEEINICFSNECYLAVAMLVRAIMDHIPPIFECTNFGEVASNYPGKSFKDHMTNLQNLFRKIADGYLHTHIRRTETLPNATQVGFQPSLDALLAEIVRKLKESSATV